MRPEKWRGRKSLKVDDDNLCQLVINRFPLDMRRAMLAAATARKETMGYWLADAIRSQLKKNGWGSWLSD